MKAHAAAAAFPTRRCRKPLPSCPRPPHRFPPLPDTPLIIPRLRRLAAAAGAATAASAAAALAALVPAGAAGAIDALAPYDSPLSLDPEIVDSNPELVEVMFFVVATYVGLMFLYLWMASMIDEVRRGGTQ